MEGECAGRTSYLRMASRNAALRTPAAACLASQAANGARSSYLRQKSIDVEELNQRVQEGLSEQHVAANPHEHDSGVCSQVIMISDPVLMPLIMIALFTRRLLMWCAALWTRSCITLLCIEYSRKCDSCAQSCTASMHRSHRQCQV